MAWYLTTKLQITAFKRELNRLDEALSRQDVRGLGSPLTRMRRGAGVGMLGGVVVVIAAFIVSILIPKPDGRVAEIVTTRNGGRFVQFNGALHPVTNLASARLIVGKPDEAKVITDAALSSLPTGPLMGIPNAPDSLAARTDTTATWTVCDWHDTAVPLSLLASGDLTTTVIAGSDLLDGGDPLGDDRAVLVRPPNDRNQLWLVYRDTRAMVGAADYAAQSALGLTPAHIDAAITVSPALLGTIRVSPALTAPQLESRGQLSPAVAGSSIGDVLTVGTASGGRSYYLVGRVGIQMIGAVLAQMMINTGSAQKLVTDPSQLEPIARVSFVDDSMFPSKVPTLMSEPALCWRWQKSSDELRAHTTVLTASSLPVSDVGNKVAVKLLPDNGSEPRATKSVTRPGLGWYVRVTGDNNDSVAAEQVMWIDAAGTSFPIDAVVPDTSGQVQVSYDPTVKALGLNTMAPTPIPWSVAKLYSPGSTLSIRAAQMMQGQLDPVKPIPSPPVSPGAAPPAPHYTEEHASAAPNQPAGGDSATDEDDEQ
ncbi:MAG: type VII secretion protein EccB [Gordonia amarae]